MRMHGNRNSLVRIAAAQRSETLVSLYGGEGRVVVRVESALQRELPGMAPPKGTEYVVSRSRSKVRRINARLKLKFILYR